MFYSHTVARSLVKLQIKSRVLVLTAIPYTAQMDIFEAMETCRAMRKLKEDPVPYELLEKLIWAATRAPNAGNAQLWNFLVVTDDEGRQFLGDLLRSKLGTGLTQPKDPTTPQARQAHAFWQLVTAFEKVPAIIFTWYAKRYFTHIKYFLLSPSQL